MTNPTPSHFHDWRRRFQTIVQPLRQRGVEVLNCTPGSALECFSKADLRDALAHCEVPA
jgi:hypothetical protein